MGIGDMRTQAAATAAAHLRKVGRKFEVESERCAIASTRRSKAETQRALVEAEQMVVKRRRAIENVGSSFGNAGLAAAMSAVGVRSFANFDRRLAGATVRRRCG